MTPVLRVNTSHPAGGGFYDLAHNRFPRVDELFGGHTWERAVPAELFEKHPEYFTLVNGQRTGHHWIACDAPIGTEVEVTAFVGGKPASGEPAAREPLTQAWIDSGSFTVEIADRHYPAKVSIRPLYDPRNERITVSPATVSRR